jgi:hypothetical protein
VRRESVRRSERGASAVEFAILSLPLFTILFGIIDYGLYFADVVKVQQGLGDAARAATLAPTVTSGPWSGSTCGLLHDSAATGGDQLERLACSVRDGVEPVAAQQLFVRAELIDATTGQPTTTWATGNRLRLCTVVDHPPVLPMVPLPGGGRIQTRVDMPVQAVVAPVQMASVQTPLPSGDWEWCDRPEGRDS